MGRTLEVAQVKTSAATLSKVPWTAKLPPTIKPQEELPAMASKLAEDPRIDPRIKAMFGGMVLTAAGDVASREDLLAQEHSAAGNARAAELKAMLDAVDDERVAPSAGLSTRTETFVSAPDGNTVNVQFIRPDTSETLPCVYYIHGGGMQTMSCYDGNYKAWGRIIAAEAVAVAMVDFRNALRASSAPEVAPFPAALCSWASRSSRLATSPAAVRTMPPNIALMRGSMRGSSASLDAMAGVPPVV